MTLQVPDALASQAGCTTEDLFFGLVVGLYLEGRLSLGQAGDALGLSKPEMMAELHERGLPMSYDAQDAASDLAAIERLWSHP